MAAVTAALIDPDAGLFGRNNVRIGASIYRSQIYAACLAVPGVRRRPQPDRGRGSGGATSCPARATIRARAASSGWTPADLQLGQEARLMLA